MSWLEQKQKRLQQEGKQDAARQRSLANESEWSELRKRAPSKASS